MSKIIQTPFYTVGDRVPLTDGTLGPVLTPKDIIHTRVGSSVHYKREVDSLAALRERRAAYERALGACNAKATDGRRRLQSLLLAIDERIKLVESVGDLNGPAIVPLFDTVTKASDRVRAARAKFDTTGPDEIRAARDALDVAEAANRAAWRAVNELLAGFNVPLYMPDLSAFENAHANVDRARRLAKNRPARALEFVLSLAARVEHDVSAGERARIRLENELTAAFFPADHEIFKWFEKRIAEGTDEPAAVQAPAPKRTAHAVRAEIAEMVGFDPSSPVREAWAATLEWVHSSVGKFERLDLALGLSGTNSWLPGDGDTKLAFYALWNTSPDVEAVAAE